MSRGGSRLVGSKGAPAMRFHSARGVTLVEMLVTLAVMVIIIPALGMVTQNYYHVYGRNFSRIQVNTQLPMAKEAAYVYLSQLSTLEVPEDNLIAFRIPVCDGPDGQPAMPFDRNGVLLALYRSNAAGSPSSSGSHLWLGRADIGSTNVTPHGKPLARNVTGLTFEYLDVDGNAISRADRLAAGFDDRTVSLIRVTITVTDPGVADGAATTQPWSDTITFVVAPRNNHD